MEPILLYFAKTVLITSLFLGVYHLFLKRDTFFKENRLFLLSGLILSLLFPLIKIEKVVVATKPVLVNLASNSNAAKIAPVQTLFTLENVLWAVYLIGCALLLVKFLVQLSSLRTLTKNAKTWKEHPFLHVETEKRISPFSFFNSIFYNPSLFNTKELRTILSHEKVHARQYHTLDILLLETLKIVLWFNPVLWLYTRAVRQNLEFLADSETISQMENKKTYQYLMLKQAVDGQQFKITNSFYNSLIKKRIVMLNQNQSKKINVFKTLFVLPLLGLFLVSFSVEEVYRYSSSESIEGIMDDKSVELSIDKDTSNDDLDKMKKKLSEDGIDFSYTAVRNDEKEIIEITLNLSGKNSKGEKFSGNYTSNSDGPIDPLTVFYDDGANLVSFGNAKHNKIRIHKMDDDVTWTTSGKTEIRVDGSNAKKTVIVNGKKLSDEEIEEIEIGTGTSIHFSSDDDDSVSHKVIRINKMADKDEKKQVMIIRNSDDDKDIEVIEKDASFLYIDNDGDSEPLYYIDGKKVSSKDVQKISPKDIKSMNVLKGEMAIEKYGKKAKDGVVEITTKKGKK
ncbi:M56 family metallopeptidase [Flagellimonas hadalis]|uniref:TonB-dependent receptor plug domain-containing protein n=1 Tax=Flagellimonas hadalis TaxID=2597517 RepID=A0A5N5IP86_9FLAO|nr:M56 family metallopeptidase [Allomuricauda hadalis]KAB5487587.1 TonB-dependent receptor plug domain-containing protein [Allomuricauda hadalis]